jgi:hypothetical protein
MIDEALGRRRKPLVEIVPVLLHQLTRLSTPRFHPILVIPGTNSIPLIIQAAF